jgi:hypothetical protein
LPVLHWLLQRPEQAAEEVAMLQPVLEAAVEVLELLRGMLQGSIRMLIDLIGARATNLDTG